MNDAGALEVYVLEGLAASQLIQAREKAFWLTKAAGTNDIVDVVVPRSSVPTFLDDVAVLAERFGAYVAGLGHVGDGNIHLSIFQPDDAVSDDLLLELFRVGIRLGGAVSGEHGLGVDKRRASRTR